MREPRHPPFPCDELAVEHEARRQLAELWEDGGHVPPTSTANDAGERAKLGNVTPHVLRRTTGTVLSEAIVPEAAAAAIMGHSIEVFHGTCVKAHPDALERDRAREALVELGVAR